MQTIKLFIATFVFLIVVDMLWLAVIAKNLYQQQIGFLFRDPILWYSIVLVYISMTIGILCFVVPKAQGQFISALLWGAVFGAVLYGVYDFTNYAIIAKWPFTISIIDIIWGTCLCALTSVFAVWMAKILAF